MQNSWEEIEIKIAIDICNCLADIEQQLQIMLGPKEDKSIYYHPKLTVDFFEQHPEIFQKASPISGSVEGVNWLNSNFEILYLTARPKTAVQITKTWLNFWGYPLAPMVFTSFPKNTVAKILGIQCAIDDDPFQISSLQQSMPVLIHDRPYNRHIPGERFNWDALEWQYMVRNIDLTERIKELKFQQGRQSHLR